MSLQHREPVDEGLAQREARQEVRDRKAVAAVSDSAVALERLGGFPEESTGEVACAVWRHRWVACAVSCRALGRPSLA